MPRFWSWLGTRECMSKSALLKRRHLGGPMHADLDLLCISVYCTADDLLPERPRNARRRLSDAEIVTLCVAQVLMGIPRARRFLGAARRQLGHLFPQLPSQDALHKRRARLAEAIEWLFCGFVPPSPRRGGGLLLVRPEPRQRRRSAAARLDTGRVRPLGRDVPPLAVGRYLRLRLLGVPPLP